MPLNLKVPDGLFEGSGGVGGSIDTDGAVESITHAYVAGVVSSFPAESDALTRKLCEPSPRPVNVAGEVQFENATLSREQLYV